MARLDLAGDSPKHQPKASSRGVDRKVLVLSALTMALIAVIAVLQPWKAFSGGPKMPDPESNPWQSAGPDVAAEIARYQGMSDDELNTLRATIHDEFVKLKLANPADPAVVAKEEQAARIDWVLSRRRKP